MSVTRKTEVGMTAEAFLAWSERQSGGQRYELLDGRAIAMASERAIHARLKYAVTRCFERAIAEAQLPCEAFVDGMAVRVDDETVFEPDAMIRCGPAVHDDTVVITDPVVVVEVASPSTQRIDALLKLTRYFRNAAILHYLIVVPSERSVVHHRRGEDGRIETTIHATGNLLLEPPGLLLDLDEVFPPISSSGGAIVP